MVKILAIGDNKNDQIVLNTLLVKSFPDAEFISSQTGAEGIERCLTLNPDIILLDASMPGMDGFEVCRVLKADELTKTIPIVMITAARTDKENRIKALEMGADAFLAKPVDESELTAQIRAMLRIKESEDRKLDENERLKRLVEERTIALQKELNERRKAEEVLRESEERFRRISSSITDISYSCKIDSNGNSAINWLYGASPKITGYTNDELFAMKCWGKLVVDEDFPIFKNHVLNLLPGQSDTCQMRLKKKDGTLIWIQATAECVKDHENADTAILFGGLVDITERKLVEHSLQEQKNEFETIFNLVPAQIWYKDTRNNIIRVNQQVCKDIGLPNTEIEGRATEELFPAFAQKYFEDDLEVIRSRKPKFGIIEQINTASGELKWHHTNKVPVFNEQDEATGIIAFALDITEGKIAEDIVNASRERWENLFNNSPSAIAIYQAVDEGADFLFTDFNLTAQKTDNLKRDEVVGKRISDLFPAADELGLLDVFRRVWRTGKTEYIDSTFYKDNRIEGWRENIIYRLNTGEIVAIYNDVSDRMKTEIALRESEQRYRQLAENSPIPVVVISLEKGNFLYVNQRTFNLIGDLPDGKTIQDYRTTDIYLNPEVRDELLGKLKNDGSISDLETKLKTLRGDVITVISSARFTNFENEPAILVSFYDITDRKKAEVALTEKNTFIQTVLDNLPIGIALNTIDTGTALYMNKKFEEIYGWPSEEIKDVADFFGKVYPDENYRNELVTKIMTDIQSGDPLRMHWENCKVTHKDDSVHIVNAVNIPLYEQNTMVSTVTDITEMKKAEQALLQSQDRYRSFISQVSEGVYRFECNRPIDITLPEEVQIDLMYDHFFIDECNDAILKMYKMSDEKEMIGKGLLDFHGGRNNAINRETLRAFIRGGYRIVNAITEELNIAGQRMYISNNSLGIVENDRLVRLWGTQTDITDKVKAEQVQQVLYSISNAALSSIGLPELIEFISKEIGKLLDSTNFYIAFYDEKTDMLSTIYERDENDVLQTWPAEGSITGFVVKKQKSMLIKDSEVQKFYDQEGIRLLGTPSKVWLGVPLTMNKKAIGALVVQSYDNPEAYTENDKRMLEFISNQVSISIERKKVEQEIKEALFKAQESDRLKSAFLANMSHEIRTPLNSIIGFSELMTDPDFGMEQQLHFAQMIIASGNTLLAIINDIMDISKIEAGQVQVQKEPVSINLLLKDIRKEYSYKASEKGIELKLDILNPKEEISIESDETKIRQVMINLVGNAIKFTKEGYIELGVRAFKDEIQFRVKDTGIGVPAEFHHKIFERFRQVEDADSRRYGGNGLGLAISKSLVELLGGKIWVESEKGKGSTFYFTIPRR